MRGMQIEEKKAQGEADLREAAAHDRTITLIDRSMQLRDREVCGPVLCRELNRYPSL